MITIYPTQVGFKLVDEEVCVSLTVHEARKLLRAAMKKQEAPERMTLIRRGIDVFNAYVNQL